MSKRNVDPELTGWRAALHEIIFEADTPAGKAFDVTLIISILLSVLAVMLDSVWAVHVRYKSVLLGIEWFFTIMFTVEYFLRLICVARPAAYARSFFGIVDLVAFLPTYLSLFFVGGQYFLVVRILRLLRIFRVFKLAEYLGEANILVQALRASRRKIVVFLFTVMILVTVLGSLMYVVEGEENGFTSIPRGIYWAIVTMTTVGYGDITPNTNLGQGLSTIVMILGYGIIAIPTGIVTVELSQAFRQRVSTQACLRCSAEGHDADAKHCKYCGAAL
jgi:voltage-gated potassium channel